MLTVVVPASDGPSTLPRCLAALERSTEPAAVEVVDAPANSGPAAARNAGAARANGAIVVFVDSDIEVHPCALRRLREALERDPQLDAVFGAYDEHPEAPSIVSRFRNLLHHHIHVSSPGPATTFWAGLGAVRREAFESVGGFDEHRFPRPSVEDIDLGMRLSAAGRRIALEPAARGTHLKRWTLLSMLRTDFLARGVPWVGLQLDARHAGDALNLARRHRLAALIAVLATALGLARRPRLAAGALLAMAAPNAAFYLLLARCGGLRLAAAGIPLHLLHHLVAVASVPVGVAMWVKGPPR